jgi:integrase
MPKRSDLVSATARRNARLPIAKRPYWLVISPGIALGYRRNAGAGTWSVRGTANGSQWVKRLALADDLEPAASPAVLTFSQAEDAARALARQQPGAPVDESRPVTVGEALDRYEADLKARGGSIYNARMPRRHLTGALLTKPVQLLGAAELRRWRDSMIGKLEPASINRVMKCLAAALTLAADFDERIKNKDARKKGLLGLPDATVARNVILDDATVRAIIAAAYDHDRALGLFVDVLARTGARPSQAARLTVAHLQADRLLMPLSAKGGTKNRAARMAEQVPVLITAALAQKLKVASVGRSQNAPLLLRSTGKPWKAGSYGGAIKKVVAAAGLDPSEVTIYALRHSSIVRSLLGNVPDSVVAQTHDTSPKEMKRHYTKNMAHHSDEVSLRGLLQDEPPADNVIALSTRTLKQ